MTIHLQPISRFETGIFDEGAAEIPAYDANTQRLFVVNGSSNAIDVLDISIPREITFIQSIDMSPFGGGINSVAVQNNIVAAAVQNEDRQAPGSVVFLDTDGNLLNSVPVGALPDMVTFTPNGEKVLVANEGEPNDDYSIDPEGSVSIIDITNGVNNATVITADFNDFAFIQTTDLQVQPVRISGPGATPAQDFEPEYITVSTDSQTAWVTLQENNALGKLDITQGQFTDILPLGFKNYDVSSGQPNRLDASDRDDGINIRHWPVFGLYQPDSIASYTVNGQTFLITANEGDSRDYDGFTDEARVADLVLDPVAFPDAAALQADDALGRLLVINTHGDIDGDGDFDQLYTYGGRSFSIWDENGNLVFDSGDDFEQITALRFPNAFNSQGDVGSFDSRSDNKGPEPEGVVVGEINGNIYAFIGLERIGGGNGL